MPLIMSILTVCPRLVLHQSFFVFREKDFRKIFKKNDKDAASKTSRDTSKTVGGFQRRSQESIDHLKSAISRRGKSCHRERREAYNPKEGV